MSEQCRHGVSEDCPACMSERIKELENGFRDIMKATVEGRVCDDVAWFDSITTLHDFCDLVLNGPDPDTRADLPRRFGVARAEK